MERLRVESFRRFGALVFRGIKSVGNIGSMGITSREIGPSYPVQCSVPLPVPLHNKC